MKLFISWSGQRSRQLAEILLKWLPGVINSIEPWLSSNDINPGSRWSSELAGQLEKTRYGIICLTAENLSSPWIHFEVGALSKTVSTSYVVPLLLDNKPADIQGPLAQFQAVQITKKDILKLLGGINLAIANEFEKSIDKGLLEEALEVWWPKLESHISKIPSVLNNTEVTEKSEKEMLTLIYNYIVQERRKNDIMLTSDLTHERIKKYIDIYALTN